MEDDINRDISLSKNYIDSNISSAKNDMDRDISLRLFFIDRLGH